MLWRPWKGPYGIQGQLKSCPINAKFQSLHCIVQILLNCHAYLACDKLHVCVFCIVHVSFVLFMFLSKGTCSCFLFEIAPYSTRGTVLAQLAFLLKASGWGAVGKRAKNFLSACWMPAEEQPVNQNIGSNSGCLSAVSCQHEPVQLGLCCSEIVQNQLLGLLSWQLSAFSASLFVLAILICARPEALQIFTVWPD